MTGASDHGEFEIDHTAEHLDHLESDRAEVRAKINLMQLTLDGATIEDFKRLVETLLVEEQNRLGQFNAMIASLRHYQVSPPGSLALH